MIQTFFLSFLLMFSTFFMPIREEQAPLGLDVVGIDERGKTAVCATGSEFQKFRIEPGYISTPQLVEETVDRCNLKVVVLHLGNVGYDWKQTKQLWETQGWGELVNRRTDVEWWLEIGNEPEVFTDFTANEARYYTLETYKMLALGKSGETPWREKYPGLKWVAQTPVHEPYFSEWFRYVPDDREGWVNMGHVADWYDAIGVHLYGDSEIFSWNYAMPYIYHDVIQHPSVKECIVTEAGINNGDPVDGMKKIADFAYWTPCLGVAAFAYFPGDCDYDNPSYELCDPAHWTVAREYNR